MLNYYEVLGLPCEPPKCHEIKRIQAALDAWKIKTEAAYNMAAGFEERQHLHMQLCTETDMQRLLSDPELRTQHAAELLERRKKLLQEIIRLMSECLEGKRKEILYAELVTISNDLSLNPPTVKRAFQDAGYIVVMKPTVDVNDVLLNETHWNKLMGHITELKNYMDANPTDPLAAMTEIKDIYDYIALMDSGSIYNTERYRSMPTETLYSIFEMKQKEHVANTAPKRIYKQIECLVCALILCDNKNREKYNNSVRLSALEAYFNLFSYIPIGMRLKKNFANKCIRQIQKTLPIPCEYAVEIYNRKCLPQDTPYSEEEAQE